MCLEKMEGRSGRKEFVKREREREMMHAVYRLKRTHRKNRGAKSLHKKKYAKKKEGKNKTRLSSRNLFSFEFLASFLLFLFRVLNTKKTMMMMMTTFCPELGKWVETLSLPQSVFSMLLLLSLNAFVLRRKSIVLKPFLPCQMSCLEKETS